MASLDPQFTEHPPQLPRGEDGAALQALSPAPPSRLGSSPAELWGGPVSVRVETFSPLPLDTQPATKVARRIGAASEAAEHRLTGKCSSRAGCGVRVS